MQVQVMHVDVDMNYHIIHKYKQAQTVLQMIIIRCFAVIFTIYIRYLHLYFLSKCVSGC